MRNKLSFKIFTNDDIPLINQASKWHLTKYGYPLDQQKLADSVSQHLNKENVETYVIGCFDNDNFIGVNTHVSWEYMPFWTFAGLIIKPDNQSQGVMSNNQIYVLSEMLEFNCKLGEDNSRNEWVTITQDSTHQSRTRHYKIMKNIYDRYSGVDLYEINPDTPNKFKPPGLAFPHKKPLVVKMFSLKNEYRPNILSNSAK